MTIKIKDKLFNICPYCKGLEPINKKIDLHKKCKMYYDENKQK